MLTLARLKEVISYDPTTGRFCRLKCFQRPDVVGNCSAATHGNGYTRVTIDGARYYLHRLAWFYMTGEWPPEVDHKNGRKADNSWLNLRSVSSSGNKQNQHRAHKNSKSGRLGVSWDKTRERWTARIKFKGHYKYLGRFADIDAASNAYIEAKRKFHPMGML